MKLKFMLASVMLLGVVSTSYAQSEDSIEDEDVTTSASSTLNAQDEIDTYFGFGGKKNCVKADYNFGWFISKIIDKDGKGHRGLFGDGISLMYEHVFKNGWGFGINGIFEKKTEEVYTGMIGPSLVCYKSRDKWTYGYSIGVGYGRFDIDSERFGHTDKTGIGYFVQIEGERRLNKWLGLGAGMRILDITSVDSDKYNSRHQGTGSLRFTVGPRFYF